MRPQIGAMLEKEQGKNEGKGKKEEREGQMADYSFPYMEKKGREVNLDQSPFWWFVQGLTKGASAAKKRKGEAILKAAE